MSESGPPARPMRYPYTHTAKLVQFPFKFHLTLNWYHRYALYGLIPTFLIYYKINSLVNSDANIQRVAKEAERDRLELVEHKKHLKC